MVYYIFIGDDDAQYYEIEYHNNYKLVTDHRNEQQYYLVQCGTPPPQGLAANAIIHNIPVTNVAALETTVVPYLEMLGVGDSIHLIADSSMVSSSCFQKYRETSNNVTELSATNVTLANQQADAVQVQFGSSFYITDENGTVTTAAVNEPDVLGRAAWLGYYAAFYNLEALANEVIANITGNYDRLKKAASGYSDDQKPLVAWTMYDAPSQYNQNTASWNVSVADFKKQVTEDAGWL
ncbi:hypothetical protein BDA99DRAFT_31496 [Phascolomyces articulosus]|uniref:Uncharacterized protein n=1 Tax=Phascolomyces articulosus TaxID=60185 RepID=A0AAD5K2X5_9FUNG|nr:hypothetical protein BDA99DRAFT_31496 [Phascolomyces articulosus]